eukprot:gene37168-48568_t
MRSSTPTPSLRIATGLMPSLLRASTPTPLSTPTPRSSSNALNHLTTSQQGFGAPSTALSTKTPKANGRVKVGVRCRPPFKDEIDACNGEFISIVDTIPEIPPSSASLSQAVGNGRLGQISLTLISGKQREFMFDYVFDINSSQDSVYDRIARPVVTDVLKECVNDEHAGIIPRAVSQIFDYVRDYLQDGEEQ